MFRSRIRVTLSGGNIHDTPVELHEQALRSKVRDLGAEDRRFEQEQLVNRLKDNRRVLPVLALNEVNLRLFRFYVLHERQATFFHG